jgi:hypothetical protein
MVIFHSYVSLPEGKHHKPSLKQKMVGKYAIDITYNPIDIP